MKTSHGGFITRIEIFKGCLRLQEVYGRLYLLSVEQALVFVAKAAFIFPSEKSLNFQEFFIIGVVLIFDLST